MDLQFWIYVIAVVAMILARAMKKSPKGRENGEQPSADTETSHSPGKKPMTFEDLLREIQQAKNPPPIVREPETWQRPIQRTIPPAKSYEVDYDDDIEEEENDLETIPAQREERSTEVYENAKSQAFQRLSLEDTMKLSDTDMKFGHFKMYDEVHQNTLAGDVLKDFRDPEAFKKAFIMSEILKRKF